MNPEHIDRLSDTLDRLEEDLERRDDAIRGRTRGVDLTIRALAGAMGILALVNLYYVNALTQEVKLMIVAMGEMTGHFGNVAERMNGVTGTIKSMDKSVALMPVIRDQMSELAGQVDRMADDVARMSDTADRMDGRMDELNIGIYDMSQRFRGLNRSVTGMGADVDQMSRPLP
jgi:methyl-accepting chemotaxis protein